MRAYHRNRTDISAVARRGSTFEPGRRIAAAGIAPTPLAYQASALLLSYAAVFGTQCRSRTYSRLHVVELLFQLS